MSVVPAIDYDRVTFGYGRTPVLREVSLRIYPGEFYAIVGANGSGKTTLMKLGLGLLRASHGTISLFGTPLRDFRDWHRVGYVPQRAAARTPLPISVEEVVRTGLAGHLGLVRRPDANHRRRIEHVLDVMGLAAIRRASIGQLSGGQQQRALIARALVTGPQLLVLDEPTTGVDADARHALRESLEHLVRVEGVAVAYISHDPEGFTGLAHHIVEVASGELIDDPVELHQHAAAPAHAPEA